MDTNHETVGPDPAASPPPDVGEAPPLTSTAPPPAPVEDEDEAEREARRKAKRAERERLRRARLKAEKDKAARATPARVRATPKAEAAHLKRVEDALAGTIAAMGDAAVALFVHPDAPRPGGDRARQVAALWAPLLAPYIDAEQASWMGWALAAGGTAAVVGEFMAALSEWRAANPDKVKKNETADARSA